MKILYRKNSQVILSAIIVLALIVSVVAVVHLRSRSTQQVVSVQVDADKADALAKSGLDIGDAYIPTGGGTGGGDGSCSGGSGGGSVADVSKSFNLGNGILKIDIYPTQGIMVSKATVGKSVRVAKKTFPPVSGGTGGGTPALTWTKAYGGNIWDYCEIFYPVQPLTDGGFILVGDTMSFGDTSIDGLIVKTYADGTKEWAKTFGNSGKEDRIEAVQQVLPPGNGYILSGETKSFTNYAKALLVKLSDTGAKEWAWIYGGTTYDEAYVVKQTNPVPGDGFIIAGMTKSLGDGKGDGFAIKVPAGGGITAGKRYQGEGGGEDRINDIQELSTDGSGYILGGTTLTCGDADGDFFALRVFDDLTVDSSREKRFGGSAAESLWSIKQTSDQGYILAGGTESFGAGGTDILVVKIDADFNVEWAKAYGGGLGDIAHTIQEVDGGYILVGMTQSFGAGGRDFLVIRTDSQGNVGGAYPGTWANTYGGTLEDVGAFIQEANDGGYIITGRTVSFGTPETPGNFNWLAIKTTSTGEVCDCTPVIINDVMGSLTVTLDVEDDANFIDDPVTITATDVTSYSKFSADDKTSGFPGTATPSFTPDDLICTD